MNNANKPNRGTINVIFPLEARTFGGRVQANLRPSWGGALALGGDAYRLEREGTNHVTFLAGPMAGNTAFFDESQHRIDTAFGENTTPGFVTVDMGGGLRFLNRYEFIVNVANLLDKNYVDHLTRENPFTGREVPEPGRVVGLSLRATF